MGIERQWSGHATGPAARFAGMRTFFILGIIGGVSGVLLGNLAIYGMDKAGMPFENPFGSEAMIIHPHVSGVVTPQ